MQDRLPSEAFTATRTLPAIVLQTFLSLFTLFFTGRSVWCEDWPMDRHDVRRSGISSESLSFPLVETWKIQSTPPEPAWPPPHFILLDRMDFDYAPQPVVAEGVVCFASTADDTVRAVDLVTGQRLWRFSTGGPIRLAPQINDGRVYFGSDDGCAYCVDLETGSLVWKFNGAPHDEKFLGNGRMISRWPIRTGVLVDGGVAYFLAGMWASEGVFAFAVDAGTGRLIWCNDTCGYAGVDYNHLLTPEIAGEMRHGVHDGDFGVYGLTPQGSLAVTADVLLVPNGYNSPAGLDRQTGRLLFAEPHAGTGGHWLMTEGDAFYSLYQHRNRRILMIKKDARTGKRLHLHHHGIRNVTTVPNSVPHLHHEVGRTRVLMRNGKAISANAFSIVLAGATLILGRDGHVAAQDPATEAELWRGTANGRVYGLAVADGSIIATTDRGTIHCFVSAPQTEQNAPTETTQVSSQASSRALSDQTRRVIDTLRQAEVDRGYALIVGDSSGEVSESIARQTSLRVVTHTTNERQAAELRSRFLDESSLYGMRLHVPAPTTKDGGSLSFAQHFANAVIVVDRTAITSEELFRVLRPCGGLLLFTSQGQQEGARFLRDLSLQLNNGEATVRETDQTIVVTRGQLPGALDWDSTHLTDRRARWPLRPLWFGGPTSAQVTDYKNGNARPPVAFGRYFVLGEETLTAVDAYNGYVLWSRPIPKRAPDMKNVDGLLHFTELVWSRELRDAHRRSVRATDQFVYLTLGEGEFRNRTAGCIVLDARTGTQKTIYASCESPPEVVLDKPQTWALEIDADHKGNIRLAQSDEGLIVELTTTDPVPTSLDEWELFFDFRPTDRRFGLYEPGVFQFRITPPTASDPEAQWKPGTGSDHPVLNLAGSKTNDGSLVNVTLNWDDIDSLVGHRPESFGFAAILNSHDGGEEERIQRSYQFCDQSATGINNGWATVSLKAASSAPVLPAIIAGELADLPKVKIARIWPTAIDPQIGSQERLHPLTGERGPRIFRSGTGTCGGFDFSATSVVKRSGAAKVLGVYDFAEDSGLHTFVGVSAGCNATTTTALGMMIVSESKARCVCTFPFRTTMTLAPGQRRLQEDWAIFYDRNVDTEVRQAHINLGAFGDRRDSSGNLWLGFPRPVESGQALGYPKLPGTKSEAYLPGIWPIAQSASLQVPLQIDVHEDGGPYRFNADRTAVHGTDRPWMYASGYRGIRRATLQLNFFRPLATQPGRTPPEIDGKIAADEWSGNSTLDLPGTQTRVYLSHDADNLYVQARRPVPVDRRGRSLWKGSTNGDDAEVWTDTSWELFLGDTVSSTVAHFGVSITGARYDAMGYRNATRAEDSSWDASWKSEVSVDDSFGAVELAIPWNTIKAAGLDRSRLAVNFLVNRDARTGEAITYLGARGRAGCSNLTPLGIGTPPPVTPRTFQVRLHFAQPPGQSITRPFDILIQNRQVARDVDICEGTDQRSNAIVREFAGIQATDRLVIDFRPTTSDQSRSSDQSDGGVPLLCAIEVQEEALPSNR